MGNQQTGHSRYRPRKNSGSELETHKFSSSTAPPPNPYTDSHLKWLSNQQSNHRKSEPAPAKRVSEIHVGASARQRRNSTPPGSNSTAATAATTAATSHENIETAVEATEGIESAELEHAENRKDRRMSLDSGNIVKDTFSQARQALTGLKKSHSPTSISPNQPQRKMKKPIDMSSLFPGLPGRRSRRSSLDQGAVINLKTEQHQPPTVPLEEIYNPAAENNDRKPMSSVDPALSHLISSSRRTRARASTVSDSHAQARKRLGDRKNASNQEKTSGITTMISYVTSADKSPYHTKESRNANAKEKEEKEKIYVAGSMTNWQAKEMSKFKGEDTNVFVIDCLPGDHQFRFYTNSKGWHHDPKQKTVVQESKSWNLVHVNKTDSNVYEALAVDSFSLKNSRDQKSEEDRLRSDEWTQKVPTEQDLAKMGDKGPPILPPQLLNVTLNKEIPQSTDPVLLPEPSRVMLGHLYAQSIRDNNLILSTTFRFRNKFITKMLYKPLD